MARADFQQSELHEIYFKDKEISMYSDLLWPLRHQGMSYTRLKLGNRFYFVSGNSRILTILTTLRILKFNFLY